VDCGEDGQQRPDHSLIDGRKRKAKCADTPDIAREVRTCC